MDKIFDTTRFTRMMFLFTLFISCFLPKSNGQGFYTKTTYDQYTYYDSQLEVYPDHYVYKGIRNFTNQSKFGKLVLDSLGVEQSWELSTINQPNSASVRWLPDNELLMFSTTDPGNNWQIKKLNLAGNELWTYSDTSNYTYQSAAIARQNAAGEIFLFCHEINAGIPDNGSHLRLMKFALNGTLSWEIHIPLPNATTDASYFRLQPTLNGGCVYSIFRNTTSNNKFTDIYNVDADGQLIWSKAIGGRVVSLLPTNEGEVYTAQFNYLGNQSISVIEKHDTTGQVIWSKKLNLLYQNGEFFAFHLILAQNDGILVTGNEYPNGQPWSESFIRFDTDGNVLWKKPYPFLDSQTLHGGISTPDNGFIVYGSSNNFKLYLLKLDANGQVYPGQLSGQLALDDSLTCQIDASEAALSNWKVQLTSQNHQRYASTDSSGHYEMLDVPNDDYLLSAIIPSNLWESCAGEVPISILDTGIVSLTQDLPIQPLFDCPFMTIDIATPVLRRCFDNNYSVHYCNEGTVAADSAYIKIHLSPLLDFNYASIPHTQIGNTLYFSLGSVPSLECGDFTFNVTVDCDSTQLGQTLCVSASIFPDTICNPAPNWLGALLEGTGNCLGDSVHFQLHNIGTGASSPGLQSYVVDEHVIMFQQPLPPLAPDAIFDITVPADGSTWRFIAEQEPNAPGLEMPSIGVEGCGTGGPPTWGFLLQFANHDGNPFSDRDCHEVVGSFDPNDKMAFPIGVQDEHFIAANQPIDYQIRFQNTGTDTAFTVVVKDTLSAWLDPATIRPGAASHPYTWALSGEGILTYTFDNILLPDSNINEAASHGFLQFSIQQRKNLLPGTRLENRAGIYFDFNEPVMTNTVFHTIGHDFLPTTTTHEVTTGLPMLQLWPNPASQTTKLSVGASFLPGQRLLLRNGLGQVVRAVTMQGPSMELPRAGLPSGLYFVEWRDERGALGVGKVIWE